MLTKTLALVFVAASVVGCHHKPIKADAGLLIPAVCMTKAYPTPKTVCETTTDPEFAICDGVAVKYTCVKVGPKK